MSEMKQSAREFVDFLVGVANASLSADDAVLSATTKSDLERALRLLVPLPAAHDGPFDQLSRWHIEPLEGESPDEAEIIYHQVWSLMSAAFLIGSLGVQSDESVKLGRKMALSSQGRDAGLASGKARSVRLWHEPAWSKATETWRKNPRLSLADVTDKVRAVVPGVPGYRSVQDFLSMKRRAGQPVRRVS